MAKFGETFNLDDMDQGYTALPDGKYNVTVMEADIEANKAGTGQLLKLKLQVIGPSHAGAILYYRINFRHTSKEAQEIGRRQLAQLMSALNIARLEDTDQFMGGIFIAKVKKTPATDQYAEGNDITGVEKADGVAAPSNPVYSQPAPAQSAPATPTAPKRPW